MLKKTSSRSRDRRWMAGVAAFAVALSILAPTAALAAGWANMYLRNDNLPGYACNASQLDYAYSPDKEPREWEAPNSSCLVDDWIYGSTEGFRFKAARYIESGRWICTGYEGTGDFAGQGWNTYTDYLESHHIEVHAGDHEMRWQYQKRNKYSVYYSGADMTTYNSGWVNEGTSIHLTAPAIWTNGDGSVVQCTGWQNGSGSAPASGTGNDIPAFPLNADSAVTWVYGVAHELTIHVSPSSLTSSSAAQPLSGGPTLYLEPSGDHVVEASVLQIIGSGSDRWLCEGYTNGFGGTPGSEGSGYYDAASSRVKVQIVFTVNSGLDFFYTLQNKLEVQIDDTLPVTVKQGANPTPAVGTNWLSASNAVTVSVNALFTDNSTGYRWQCAGWENGYGNLPTYGTSASTNFVLNQYTRLKWLFRRVLTYNVQFDGLPSNPPELRADPAFIPSQAGTNYYLGDSVTLHAPAVLTNGNERYICTGWSGTGDIAPGVGNSAGPFTVGSDSTITWKFRKENKLTVIVNPSSLTAAAEVHVNPTGEATTPAGSAWFSDGTNVTVDVLKVATLNGTNFTLLGVSASGAAEGSTNIDVGVTRLRRAFAMTEPAQVIWLYDQTAIWQVGQPIDPPDGVQSNVKPSITIVTPTNPDDTSTNSFFWGGPADNKKLYPVRPIPSVVVSWLGSGGDSNVLQGGLSEWPPAASRQLHVANVAVDLQQVETNGYTVLGPPDGVPYTTGDGLVVNKTFYATRVGFSVVHFAQSAFPDAVNNPSKFIVVETISWDDAGYLTQTNWSIGTAITNQFHAERPGVNGYVYFPRSFYNANAYDPDTRAGPIIPVNEDTRLDNDDMVVIWYSGGDTNLGMCWPTRPYRYQCSWPADGVVSNIYIASQAGSGPLSPVLYPEARLYVQPDTNLPGFNPNEEHAWFLDNTVFALRNDLNGALGVTNSKPYVLLEYMDPVVSRPAMKVYKVLTEGSGHQFDYPVTAGQNIFPPHPLEILPLQAQSTNVGGRVWYYRDHKGGRWAKAASSDTGTPAQITMQWYYPLQQGWYFPDYNHDNQPDAQEGDPVPFLNGGRDYTNTPPSNIVYTVSWPSISNTAVLAVGETVTSSKHDLPDIINWACGEIIFDEGLKRGIGPLAKLFDPLSERWVALDELPSDILTEDDEGRKRFKDLPYYLKSRLSYDPISKRLYFNGVLDSSGVGEPLLLPNVMTAGERERLEEAMPSLATPILLLYDKTRNPNGFEYTTPLVENPMDPSQTYSPGAWNTKWGILLGLDADPDTGQPVEQRILGLPKALTAGSARDTGWVTLVENDDDILGAAKVSLHVIRVDNGPYVGEIKVIESDNVFDEKLTLRHSGDFGGEPDQMYFKWYYKPDTTGFAPELPPNVPPGTDLPGWILYDQGYGLQEITIEGSSPLTIADNWVAMRYGYTNAYPFITNNFWWSRWAGQPGGQKAQLAEGWIKRVVAGLNPFDARVRDFHASPVNTIVSMISQAGPRYEGPIAYSSDPCSLNSIGLVEAYDTVFRSGKNLSIDLGLHYSPANNALLNIATRLSDLYMLLGNEAYQDALDPTIGFGTSSGEYGTLAPSIFAFMNQVPSLLEEELVLLRGRDDSAGPTRAAPIYNRFFWNFTQGQGEVAYVQAYNISDQKTEDSNNDGCIDSTDGIVDEDDAKVMYPQGHGDAWGHYLSAIKYHYGLLTHEHYTWASRPESVLVGGAPVLVDYLDERKFAQAAAAKAQTGADIVDLTYREFFVDDPAGQWQGYKDTDRDRAWGVDDWARRAGQGAYFDWVVANAILPAVDPNTNHTGIAKIDRTTVDDLSDITTAYQDIQHLMDEADRGLNPLGLAKGVVPFDIDPTLLDATYREPMTHFEQVYDRAMEAMKNAVSVFDYANQLTKMLRQNQDTLDDQNRNIDEQERDYLNRLIEIFGYPYADDIGPNGTYPSGYDGPDWIHYMYIEPSELTGDIAIEAVTNYDVTFDFASTNGLDQELGIVDDIMTVEYTFSSDGAWMVKPPDWTGQRRAPGEIQLALSDLLQAKSNLEKAMTEYNNLIELAAWGRDMLAAQYNLASNQIQVVREANSQITTLDEEIYTHKQNQLALARMADISDRAFEAIIEGIPKVAGITASDVCAPARAILYAAKGVVATAFNIAADCEEAAQLNDELAKDAVNRNKDLELQVLQSQYDLRAPLGDIQGWMTEAGVKRMECATLKEQIEQALGRCKEIVARGQRLMDERATFRRKVAPEIQDLRYQDMAFRVFRNDALQKYRAQFDLAARYVYLAATAYDYETCLLGTDNGAGREFLTDIVRQRSLGQIIGELPIAGRPGLADPLARMGQNFAVYKTQMGFNNPQTETSRFSLRQELFRIRPIGPGADQSWRNLLEKYRVADLWQVPDFRRYCRPFAPEDAGAQPGLVIPFSTEVQYGKNFFGWPLGGGDSTYDPTHFATKIRSVGCWFSNYNAMGLSYTPRVYLVPVGADVLRSPSDVTLKTREWKVVDQKIPVPFPIGDTDLNNSEWIPINDSLSDTFADIRRFSRFRAYHDSGTFTSDETTSDSRLIGRSVWNTRWLLIIPGETLLNPPDEGLDTFIYGQLVPGGGGARDNNGVRDIRLFFQTYAYSGD